MVQWWTDKMMYCTQTIISRSLYIFTPFFSAVYNQERLSITDNLCTKQGNVGLKSAVYYQERFQIKSVLSWRAYGIYSCLSTYLKYRVLLCSGVSFCLHYCHAPRFYFIVVVNASAKIAGTTGPSEPEWGLGGKCLPPP